MPAEFTCSEGTAGPGILSCAGTTASGSDVDTSSTPGTHTLRVTATSTDGQSTTRTVTYTVRPDNREAPRFKALANGTFIVTVKVPGPGRVDILVTAWNDNLATTARLLNPAPRRFVFARGHATAKRAKTLQITVKPNARGRQLVAGHTYRVTLRLCVNYTPHGGRQRNIGYYHVLLP